METKEIINIIETEFKKSKLSSILNKGKSYLIENYVQFVASCPMALPFAENYKFANKEFNKEYYDLFDSIESWKNLKGKGYKKFLQVADNDIVLDEKITFGIDVCVTDNSINYYILTPEFKDPFFKENPLYFENEKELKFILGIVFDNLSLTESKKSTRKSIKESLNFKNYAVEVIGTYWLRPFYWYFNEFKDDLLIASEEYGFTYYITEATTTEYRINIKFNDNLDVSYDIKFRIIPRTDKATAKELNDYLN